VPFNYDYTIELRDTDAAGVVYFANIISICHIAYEASLIRSGIDLKYFVTNSEFAIPLFHVSANFLSPLFCGDRIIVQLIPAPIVSSSSKEVGISKFEIKYQILSTHENNTIYATAITRHIVINPHTRKRQPLPAILIDWLADWNLSI
jgi:1,4-dihydroxy-2-naphthoyl-CoA hydrolase